MKGQAGEVEKDSDGRPEFVSISECAKRLTDLGQPIDRSALSRYCDEHGLKVGKVPGIRGVAVDFNRVKEHRELNYQRHLMAGGEAETPAPVEVSSPAPVVRAPEPIAAEDEPADLLAPRPIARDPDPEPLEAEPSNVIAADPHRREKEAKAQRAEIELAKIKEEITYIADVDAGLGDAIGHVRAAAPALAKQAANEAAAELGIPPDQIRALTVAFKTFYRSIDNSLIDSLGAITAEARESRSSTRRRLEALAQAAHAARQNPETIAALG